jgi:hypothetical protein
VAPVSPRLPQVARAGGKMPRPFRQPLQFNIRRWYQPPLSFGPSWSLELS